MSMTFIHQPWLNCSNYNSSNIGSEGLAYSKGDSFASFAECNDVRDVTTSLIFTHRPQADVLNLSFLFFLISSFILFLEF